MCPLLPIVEMENRQAMYHLNVLVHVAVLNRWKKDKLWSMPVQAIQFDKASASRSV